MKQIKTIIERRDQSKAFDLKVNRAISDGWQLFHLGVSDGLANASASLVFYPTLVAVLEKEVPDVVD